MANFQFAIGKPFVAAPSGGNLVANPGAEVDTSGWTSDGTGTVLSRDTTTFRSGVASLKIAMTGATFDRMRAINDTWLIPVSKGTNLSVRTWVKGASTAIGKQAELRIAELGTGTVLGIATVGLTTSWQELATSGVVQTTNLSGVRLDVGLWDDVSVTPEITDVINVDDVFAAQIPDATVGGDFLIPVDLQTNSEQSDWLATNIRKEHLKRAWRSLDVAGDWVYVDFGEQIVPTAVLIEDANIASVVVASSATDDFATLSYNQTQTIDRNERTDRYSALHVIVGSPTPQRFWRVAVLTGQATVPIANQQFFSIGRITWIRTLNTMLQNWGQPYVRTPILLGSQRQLPGGLVESAGTSDVAVEFDVTGQFDHNDTALRAQLNKIARLRPDERMLHFENRSGDANNADAYLVHRVSGVRISEQFPVDTVDVTLREVI